MCVCFRSVFTAPLADVRLESGVGVENFLLVMRAAFIKNDVAYHHQKLLTLSGKPAREWLLARHID